MKLKFKKNSKVFISKCLNLKEEISLRLHIRKIYSNLGIKKSDIDETYVIKHKQYWKQLKRSINPTWFNVYHFITKNPDIFYVPENIYFNIIEKKLNNRKLALAYADKNFYELFYEDTTLFPESIIRNIDKIFYDRSYKILNLDDNSLNKYLINYQKILIKPSTESGGGKNIQLFFNENGHFKNEKNQILSIEYLNSHYNQNYIIQNYIVQNKFLSQFNSSSVNTIRIFTYRSLQTDEIIPLHAVLRIGKIGNYVDDQNVGGVACRILDTNKLNNYATNITGKKYYEHNGVNFSDIPIITNINEMKEIAISIARKNIHSRLIGFDFTIDSDNNVKLIEINHLWIGINFFQMNGISLFGKYTDEVVQFCKEK